MRWTLKELALHILRMASAGALLSVLFQLIFAGELEWNGTLFGAAVFGLLGLIQAALFSFLSLFKSSKKSDK